MPAEPDAGPFQPDSGPRRTAPEAMTASGIASARDFSSAVLASAVNSSEQARSLPAPVQAISTIRVQEVEAEPQRSRQMLYDEAYRLAVAPHGTFDDFTQTALWSALAAVAGAGSGLGDILAKDPTQKWTDLVEIVVFIACVALALPGLFKNRDDDTALEYLDKLYKMPESPGKPSWIAKLLGR